MPGAFFQCPTFSRGFFRATAIFVVAMLVGAPAFADDEEPDPDSGTIDVKNLDKDSPDYVVDKTTTLVVVQSIGGEYSGTFGGPLTVEKYGEGDLNFSGKLESLTGHIAVYEGTLIFSKDFSVSGNLTEIYSESNVVFNISGTLDAHLLEVEGTGTVISQGSGTLTTGNLAGSELIVRAGTLIVAGRAEFDEITVGRNAELCIGGGDATGGISGDVYLEENSILRFNRVSTASTLTCYGEISGSGSVIFDGDITTQLTASAYTYTGNTTINAGTVLFWNSTPIEVTSPLITVNGGALGGNAILDGDVEIKGHYFGATGTPVWGGTLYLAVSGATLTIKGDLTFDPMMLELVRDSSGNYGWAFADYGGVTQVYLSDSGCTRVDVEGTITLGGMLILSGSGSLQPGQVAIFMHSDTEIVGDFDYVLLESDNVMLVTSGVAGIGANEYGIAAIENRDLRERSSFKEHNGISNFVDYITSQTSAARPNEVGQVVNLTMGDSLSKTVNNLSPLAHCSLLSMGVRQSNLEVDYLRRLFLPGTHGPESPDGISVPNNLQFFSSILAEFVENKDEVNTPIFDTSSIGAIVGAYHWVDSDRFVGASLGIHRGSAQTHGYKDGTFEDVAFRLRLFAGMMPANEDWNLLFGVSAAGHIYDVDHETATGMNYADEYGMEAGAFIVWQSRSKIADDCWFVPYARMDYNYIRVDSMRESGSPSALDINAFGYSSFRGRVGFGIEQVYDAGTSNELTLGVDFGLVAELGKDPRISSRFRYYDDSSTTIRGTVEDRGAVEITPRMRLHLDKNWMIDFSVRLQATASGGTSDAVTFGVSSCF